MPFSEISLDGVMGLPKCEVMKPLVSILIPAYNAEEFVGDAIRSAIAQTWQRKEIIVVDDGSSDRTAEVARRFASKEVIFVSKENEGAAATRNHAFQLIKGSTFNGWTRMIFWRRTRSSGSLQLFAKVIANGCFSPRRGASLAIGPNMRASSLLPSGRTLCLSSGF